MHLFSMPSHTPKNTKSRISFLKKLLVIFTVFVSKPSFAMHLDFTHLFGDDQTTSQSEEMSAAAAATPAAIITESAHILQLTDSLASPLPLPTTSMRAAASATRQDLLASLPSTVERPETHSSRADAFASFLSPQSAAPTQIPPSSLIALRPPRKNYAFETFDNAPKNIASASTNFNPTSLLQSSSSTLNSAAKGLGSLFSGGYNLLCSAVTNPPHQETARTSQTATPIRHLLSMAEELQGLANSATHASHSPLPSRTVQEEGKLHSVWQIINQNQGRRIVMGTPQNTSPLFESIYFQNRFERATSLVQEYEVLNPFYNQHSVLRSTLEELRIMPQEERGIIDTLPMLSKAGRAYLCRMLCSTKSVKDLRDLQQFISGLTHSKNAMRTSAKNIQSCDLSLLKTKLHEVSTVENFFLATLAQEECPVTGWLEFLKDVFPNESDEVLNFIAHSPLMHYVVETFNIRSMDPKEYENISGHIDFWQDHCTYLLKSLQGLKNLAGYITLFNDSSKGISPEARTVKFELLSKRLFTPNFDVLCTMLQKFISGPKHSMKIKQFHATLAPVLKFITYERQALINAYAAFGEVDALFQLASLVTNENYCYPAYIEDNSQGPRIHMIDGRCLLLDRPMPYSCMLGTDQPKTMLVTGVNGSGKSIFFYTLGSAAHLALTLGIAPARFMALTPVSILTSCNIHDSTYAGESLFVAQAKRLGEILKTVKEDGLYFAILDEPITSTRHAVANALVTESIKSLHAMNNVAAVISTHHDAPELFVDTHAGYIHGIVNPDHTLSIKNENLSQK